jgi:hypothetical protein
MTEGGQMHSVTTGRGAAKVLIPAALIALAWSPQVIAAPERNTDDSAATADGLPNPASFTPNKDVVFQIARAIESPQIDGRLDDPIWTRATRVGNFCEVSPGENVEPPVKTEAMFTYDDDNLYVAFVCHDDPAGIRASIGDRDAIFQDDFVGIMIDTFRDQKNAYEFFVNPYGIQGDLRRTGNNEDSSYDAVWYSGGQIDETGWTAEMSIPFRSIRFPDAVKQGWGMHILRIRPRDSREELSWVPISRDETCLFCNAGMMEGLEGINRGKNLELLPYVIGSQSGYLEDSEDPSSAFIEERGKTDAGLGVKYGITSNYTLDFSYNPDFSQIESDAAQIDVNTTFALFYPERRPFFQEGADIFATLISTVYTRSINDPIMAGKITGKSGNTTIGYLAARDETTPYIVPFEESSQYAVNGRSYSNILRVKRDILEDSFLGLIATDRRNETNGGTNTNVGFDGEVRFLENYRIRGQLQGSYTNEPDDTTLSASFDDIRFGDRKQYDSFFNGEKYSGYATELYFIRDARHLNFSTWYEDYSPTFRAENGFVTANNYREVGFWTGYLFYTDNGRFTEVIEPQLDWGRKYNHDDVFKDEWLQPNIWIRFRKQTYLWVGYLLSHERYAGVHVAGIRRFQVDLDTDFSAYLSGGVWAALGHSIVRDAENPRLGYQRSLEFWGTLKPTSQLQLSLTFQSFRMEELADYIHPVSGEEVRRGAEIYDVYIGRARLSYQFTKNLFFRLVTQYVESDNLFELDPLLSYKLNPFTVFFLGSSHNFVQFDSDEPDHGPTYRQSDRTYFVKFQYLFRV